MKQTIKRKRAALMEKWNAFPMQGVSAAKQTQQLVKAAKALGYYVKTGWVVSAGGYEGGNYVQFAETAYHSYMSPWPQWAYDLAMQALLNRKKLLVASDGEPVGDNLLQVMIVHFDV